MSVQVLEWIGYSASVTIAISMAISSIVKFRWVNLVGALLFSIYGFLIGSLPVGFLNGIIVVVDAYYLYLIYSRKDVYEVLGVRPDNKYLLRFIEFHQNDMQKFFPEFEYKPDSNTITYLVLRNMAVAGVFVARTTEIKNLEVEIDYVLPEYRDFKNGKYVYYWLSKKFSENGYTKIIATGASKEYDKYLVKLGFTEEPNGKYVKILE
ncbi:MAG: hypothetical protein AB7S48_01305 [Bacteroidales bacterium]